MILGQLFTFLTLDFLYYRMREIPPYLTLMRSYENNQQSTIHKCVPEVWTPLTPRPSVCPSGPCIQPITSQALLSSP